jgi:hypothetical protein
MQPRQAKMIGMPEFGILQTAVMERRQECLIAQMRRCYRYRHKSRLMYGKSPLVRFVLAPPAIRKTRGI